MQLTTSHPRTRPIAAGHLRAFEACLYTHLTLPTTPYV
jgi:hypothetical protein